MPAETRYGTSGDDVFVVDDPGDVIIEAPDAGTDTVQSWIYNYALAANIENLTLFGGAIYGWGNALDNVITGNASDNYLAGRGGNDTLIGGFGNDFYFIEGTDFDTIIENPGQGVDTVYGYLSAGSYSLPDNVENYFNWQPSNGVITIRGNSLANMLVAATSQLTSLYGMAGNDTLIGSSSNEILDGGTGADRMIGGEGNDALFVDDSGDFADGGAGNDTVYTMIDFNTNVQSANVENIIINTSAGRNVIANSYTIAVYGNIGNDAFNLVSPNYIQYNDSPGNDSIFIYGSNVEMLNGTGTSSDNDSIYVYDGILSPGGAVVMHLGAASAIFWGSGNFTATGNARNNAIFGGPGNDVIDGRGGADDMRGYAGDDSFVVDNVGDIVRGGTGIDQVSSSINYILPADVEHLMLTGSAQSGTGNALDNVIRGNGLTNYLDGRGGNDVMEFGTAPGDRDLVWGGQGADVFHFYGFGQSGIQDFQLGVDKIDIDRAWGDIQPLLRQVNEDVLIDFGGGNGLVIENMTVGQLSASDFIL